MLWQFLSPLLAKFSRVYNYRVVDHSTAFGAYSMLFII
jgi:hypothetical protein